MTVGRKARCPLAAADESCELARELECDRVEALGVELFEREQMREQWLVTVHGLEQEEISDLGDAASRRIDNPRSDRLRTLLEQPVYLGEEACELLARGADQGRGDTLLVERDRAIGTHLDDARDPDAGISREFVGLKQVAGTQAA